jgi:hypothetical protein
VLVLDWGLLDLITWGTPFESPWQSTLWNVARGAANAFGKRPFYDYGRLGIRSWTWFAVPLVLVALVGCVRAPLYALVAATVVISHSFVPHKEYRFVCMALFIAPVLVGLGASYLCRATRIWVGDAYSRAVYPVLICYVALASYFAWSHGILFLNHTRGNFAAFLAAHRAPQLCGIAVADTDWALTGGYTYLDRHVPIYYSLQHGDFVFSNLPMLHSVELGHSPIPLDPADDVLRYPNRFNFLLAAPDRKVEAFKKVGCFTNGTLLDWPVVCLFERPGNCS